MTDKQEQSAVWQKLDLRFGGNRIYRFAKEFILRVQSDRIGATAAQLAYYLLLSSFPFMIFLLTIVRYTPLGQEEVLDQVMAILPEYTARLIRPILWDIVSKSSEALLSISLAATLYVSSAGMRHLIRALDRAYDIEHRRNFFLQIIVALLATLALALIILFTLLSQVFGGRIADWVTNLVNGQMHIDDHGLLTWLFTAGRFILPLAVMILFFTLFYRYAPNFTRQNRVSWRYALIGALLAAGLWTLISWGFGVYVKYLADYTSTYGSLGGIIVLLIWLNLASLSLMIGAEFAATCECLYEPYSLIPDDPTADLEALEARREAYRAAL